MVENYDTLPGICRAVRSIAYDNGAVHRGRDEATMLVSSLDAVRALPDEFLREADAWFQLLSDEQVNTVCNDEESESEALLETAPPGTGQLLNDIFECV